MVKLDASKGCYRCWIGKIKKGGSWVSGLFSLLGFGFLFVFLVCLFGFLFIYPHQWPMVLVKILGNFGDMIFSRFSLRFLTTDSLLWPLKLMRFMLGHWHGIGERRPYLAVRNFTAAFALWCATLAVLYSGIIMAGLCFALAQVHCSLLF